MEFASLEAYVVNVAGPREVIFKLMRAEGEHPVCGVEGLFHAVAMMNINIDIQDSLVHFQQFKYGQHDIVDIAEATGLGLLGVMKPARPVDDRLVRLLVQHFSGHDFGAGVGATVLVEIVNDRAVVSEII